MSLLRFAVLTTRIPVSKRYYGKQVKKRVEKRVEKPMSFGEKICVNIYLAGAVTVFAGSVFLMVEDPKDYIVAIPLGVIFGCGWPILVAIYIVLNLLF